MKTCRRCVVSGRVQGVFFRAHTRDKAVSLGLDGHAINLADGRVEVLVSGTKAEVDVLCDWLWEGPPMAHVNAVECEASTVMPAPGFRTG